jgi:putative addiction module killer protein
MSAASITILRTGEYSRWLSRLRDARARARILKAVDNLSLGRFGNVKSVGAGISEVRIDHGPGYRIYFKRRGATLLILLTGGDKSRQQEDIARARALADAWEQDHGV